MSMNSNSCLIQIKDNDCGSATDVHQILIEGVDMSRFSDTESSGGENSPCTLPQRDFSSTENMRKITMIHVFMKVSHNKSEAVKIAFDLTGLETTRMSTFKESILSKLKSRIAENGIKVDSSIQKDLSMEDPDAFTMKFPTTSDSSWIRDESKRLISYVLLLNPNRVDPLDSMTLEMIQSRKMPAPSIQVTISSTQQRMSDLSSKAYTVYDIDIVFNSMQWNVQRRYNEFLALDEHLRTNSGTSSGDILPNMPSKHIFHIKNEAFIDSRRRSLQKYLQDIVAIPYMSENIYLLSFFGVLSTSRNSEINPDGRQIIHISEVDRCFKYGDIVLFKCRYGASKVQRTFTGSRYDHVGIIVPGSKASLLGILEATGEGCQVYSLKSRLFAYAREVSNTIVVRRLYMPRNEDTMIRLQKFLLQVEGNSYSLSGMLGGLKKVIHPIEKNCNKSIDEKKINKKYFCSELVAAALSEMHCLSTTHTSGYFWPGDFSEEGDIDKYLAEDVAIGPELAVDCKIMEVQRAVKD